MTEVFSPLTTSVDSRPMFNGGVRRRSIDTIVVHHNATTNKDVALNTWLVENGNYTSAHYEITDTEVIGAVGENYIAYHAGGTGGADVPMISDPNGRSIGLEHVNSSGAPDWEVSNDTLRNSARLIADICNRYGLPINRDTIKLHREVTATACPGGLNIDKLISYAQSYANGQSPLSVPEQHAITTTAPDQILEVGSTVRIDGIFCLDDLVPYNGGYYTVSTPLLIPKVDYHNYIPVGPLTETDDKGNATADQDFSNAGHSYFVFGGQEFKVSDVDVESDAVEVQIGGEPVWMPAGPLTEVQN